MNSKLEELYRWVEDHTLSRPKVRISRDFADAVPLVDILKVYWPRLVEEHNYSSSNSFAGKKANWELLNRRVLKKLKLHLSDETIDNLARSTPGEIEKVLFEIKAKVDGLRSARDEDGGDRPATPAEKIDKDEDIVNEVEETETEIEKVFTEEDYEKLKNDLQVQEQLSVTLNGRIAELEKLINLKESLLMELKGQLEEILNNPREPKKRFGFFKFFS